MGFFSKKITTEKIAESLSGFFDAGYGALVAGLKDIFKDQQISIDKEQDEELIFVSMFAITRAVLTTFEDGSATKNIIGKFQHDVFNQYFKDVDERNKFGGLFWQRCNEYSKILNQDNKDLAIQFGQIFCNHFFSKEEDGSHLVIMMFISGSFLNQTIETKKFLNEILLKYKVI